MIQDCFEGIWAEKSQARWNAVWEPERAQQHQVVEGDPYWLVMSERTGIEEKKKTAGKFCYKFMASAEIRKKRKFSVDIIR